MAEESKANDEHHPPMDEHHHRMEEHMTGDGKWTGGFTGCSKKVQKRLDYRISKKAWRREDFPHVDFNTVNFKDVIATQYMEWSFISQQAKRIIASSNLQKLLTMTKAQQAKAVPAAVLQKFKTGSGFTAHDFLGFKTIPSSPEPLVILGNKGKKILALRICIPSEFLVTLRETMHLLPKHCAKSGTREEYKTRNYCLWAKYADHPYLSKDLLQDGEGAKQFLAAQAPLFKYLSEALKFWDFECYETMTNHTWLDRLMAKNAINLGQKIVPGHPSPEEEVPLHKVAGAWYGLAVSCNQQTVELPHRDASNVRQGLSCVIPWGEWEGADLLFWEIRKRVQVSEGEVIFFRSKALTHNVTPLKEGGVRNILDLYSHQGVLDVDKKRRHHGRRESEVKPKRGRMG